MRDLQVAVKILCGQSSSYIWRVVLKRDVARRDYVVQRVADPPLKMGSTLQSRNMKAVLTERRFRWESCCGKSALIWFDKIALVQK